MSHPPDLDDPTRQGPTSDQEGLADLPGWAPLPPSPPGPSNPDPIPPGPTGADPGDVSASPGPGPSTPGSTRKLGAALVGADDIGVAVSSVVSGIGETLNHLTAVDPSDDIWLATNQEAKGIGKPIGRILARRVPDLPVGDGADLADLISASIPAALYLVRNLATWLPRIRKRRKPRDGAVRAPDLADAAVTA